VLGFALHSDGAGHDSLKLEYNGAQKDLAGGKTVTTGAYSPITMNGREVSLYVYIYIQACIYTYDTMYYMLRYAPHTPRSTAELYNFVLQC
jgi:predicted DNA-binding helix-hairpin-helix protein